MSDLHHHRETWGCNLKKMTIMIIIADLGRMRRLHTGQDTSSFPNFAHTFTPTDYLELPISLMCVSLDCGRKTECPERARDKARTPAAGHFCQRKMTPAAQESYPRPSHCKATVLTTASLYHNTWTKNKERHAQLSLYNHHGSLRKMNRVLPSTWEEKMAKCKRKRDKDHVAVRWSKRAE